MPIGTDQTTITTGDVFIPEVWSNRTITARESRLVMKGLIESYSGFAGDSGFGDTVHIPNISDFTANDKLANTEVTLNANTETDNTILVDTHKEASYLIEDRLKVVALSPYLAKLSMKAGYAVAKAFDSDITGAYASAGDFSGTAEAKISRANVVTAIFKLDDADVPADDRAFVVGADGYADLLDLDEATLFRNTGQAPAAIVTGFVGEFLGLPLYRSTNIATEASTSNVIHNLVFHREAFGFVDPLPPRTQGSYSQKDLGFLYTVDEVYGTAVLRADHLVDFRSLDRT